MSKGIRWRYSKAARRLGIDRGMLDRWRRACRGSVDGASRGAREDERDAELRRLRERLSDVIQPGILFSDS